jgi:hypothetical protein
MSNDTEQVLDGAQRLLMKRIAILPWRLNICGPSLPHSFQLSSGDLRLVL